MTIASDLLQRHIQTLVADNAQWQTLIADDLLWELVYAPAIGHPARLSGREEVVRHVTWFLGAVENFRFFDLKLYALTDPPAARSSSHGGRSAGRCGRSSHGSSIQTHTILEETVVAAPHDVQGYSIEANMRATGHALSISQ